MPGFEETRVVNGKGIQLIGYWIIHLKKKKGLFEFVTWKKEPLDESIHFQLTVQPNENP